MNTKTKQNTLRLATLGMLAALAVLLYSLGRAKGRIKEKSGFTAACMLGAPLAAPAKLVFKALGLSAQSDVTEEDVLSFVDDVEGHDGGRPGGDRGQHPGRI